MIDCRAVFEQAALGILCISLEGNCLKSNQAISDFLGYSSAELQSLQVQDISPDHDWQTDRPFTEQLFQKEIKAYQVKKQFICKDGSQVAGMVSVSFVRQPDRTPAYFVWMVQPISSAAPLSEQAQQVETDSSPAMPPSTAQEKLIGVITHHLRQSLNLKQVLQTTVNEVRQFLHADRVLIYRLSHVSNISGSVVVESCSAKYPSLKDWKVGDSSIEPHHLQPYHKGKYQSISSIAQSGLPLAYVQLLETFQIRSNLIIPILHNQESCLLNKGATLSQASAFDSEGQSEDQIWGFLIVHQCDKERVWQPSEIDFLQDIESHLAVAIQQAELYEQLQQLNADLEHQVCQKTTQLQQALASEAVLRRITEKIRDTLDERAILKTAVQELTRVLHLMGCHASLYHQSFEPETSCYPFYQDYLPIADLCTHLEQFSEIHETLSRGSPTRFCPLDVSPTHKQVSVLTCPITDNQDRLGNLWLLHAKAQDFSHQDIQLVQQVANQCAIAIRQSRLYQTAQTQIEELQKLNRLKDDFLSTTSHELRTPLSSIKTATQLLELILKQAGIITPEAIAAPPDVREAKTAKTLERCLKTLTQECDREINLINDLLMLQQLDAGNHPLVLSSIHLQDWVPQVVETFAERFASRQQACTVTIAPDLPPLISDLFLFDRFLDELLTNAYKFTPAAGQVSVTAQQNIRGKFQLCISNTGIEIPASEVTAIFDRFYRIPSADPWKHGGTGLGLALVRKVVGYLGGTISVSSGSNQTRFTVELPSITTATRI